MKLRYLASLHIGEKKLKERQCSSGCYYNFHITTLFITCRIRNNLRTAQNTLLKYSSQWRKQSWPDNSLEWLHTQHLNFSLLCPGAVHTEKHEHCQCWDTSAQQGLSLPLSWSPSWLQQLSCIHFAFVLQTPHHFPAISVVAIKGCKRQVLVDLVVIAIN